MRMKEQYHLTDDAPFNLSHSGNYVLCSAAPCGEKVGCDIETVGVFREAIARRFFCPEECRDIMSCAEEERAPRFYQYWVLKESFIKATRKGMGLGLDTFEFQIPEGASPYLLSQPSEIKETYYFHQYPHSAAKIAVCSTNSKFAAELQIIDL